MMTMTRKAKITQLEEWQKAWLACAIDSEGNIYAPVNCVRLEIVNTNIEFVLCVTSMLGDRAKVYTRKRRSEKETQAYTVVLGKQYELREILRQVLPYLIIKKEKARQVIERCYRGTIYEQDLSQILQSDYILSTTNRR